MAPPISRRSKEISAISLTGIALGIFAALAASFAASRALRRKRPSKSLEDEQQSILEDEQQSIHEGNPPFKEREIETKEKDDGPFLINSNGTIRIAQEPSKLAAGSLKPVFDAIEEVSSMQERDAIRSKEEENFGEDGEGEKAGSGGDFEENEKGGETTEKDKTNEEEGEIAEVVVEIEASLTVDDASVKALQSSIGEKGGGQGEREAGRKRTDGEENGVIVIKDKDMGGDDERSSADQQPSPVLINGKKLDFSEEVTDTKDDTNLLSSESNLLSDGFSESSVQEVSSEPVRPFVHATEESLEAERPGAKPGLTIDLNQSGEGIGSPEDEKETLIKLGSPTAVMDVKGDSDKASLKANGLDERIAESTTTDAEVLSNGSSSLKELDDYEHLDKCEHAVQSTREVSADDFTGLQDKGENIVERTLINGKDVPLEESADNVEAMTTDETNLPKGQEGTDGTKSDIHKNPDLLAASELLGDKTCVSSENEHAYDGESADEQARLEYDTSEEGAGAESLLEEPKSQPATQNFDNGDGTTAGENVKLEQEQPNSLPVASKGITEGSELSSEGSTDNANTEDKDDELSGEVLVKDRSPIKEQEVEVMTRLCGPNDGVSEKKVQTFLMDPTQVTHNRTREADGLLFKGAVHQHGLQPKGISVSKALEYLPLEIIFFGLLIALLSYVLWYLEMLPAISQLELAKIY